MTWAAPPAFVSGNVLTAAQLTVLANDLLETAAAKATTAGSMFVGAGANSIVERQWADATADPVTPDTWSNTFYGELGTHQNLTLTTSGLALVMLTARLQVDTVNGLALKSFQVSGASTVAADDGNALMQWSSTVNARIRATAVTLITSFDGMAAGSSTFKAVYKVTSGTMTAAARSMLILPL